MTTIKAPTAICILCQNEDSRTLRYCNICIECLSNALVKDTEKYQTCDELLTEHEKRAKSAKFLKNFEEKYLGLEILEPDVKTTTVIEKDAFLPETYIDGEIPVPTTTIVEDAVLPETYIEEIPAITTTIVEDAVLPETYIEEIPATTTTIVEDPVLPETYIEEIPAITTTVVEEDAILPETYIDEWDMML